MNNPAIKLTKVMQHEYFVHVRSVKFREMNPERYT